MNPVEPQPSYSASVLFRSGIFWALALCLQSGALAAEAWWDRIDMNRMLPADVAISSVIDQYVDENLSGLKVSPAPEAPPETRFRRLMLDLHGRIPTLAEMDEFLAGNGTRENWQIWVDRLIEAKGFDSFQANELNWLLMDGQGT